MIWRKRATVNGRRLLVVMSFSVIAGLLSVLALEKTASGARTLPDGFVQSRVTGGLTNPTTMAFAPDGRLFVAEQEGILHIVENGKLLGTPFLDISSRVDPAGERGLLGFAFDPNFSANNYVYVYYTQDAPGTNPSHNRVVRFTASGDRAVMSSERLILRLNNLSDKLNHNGGALNFGDDGKLYVAVGENAEPDNAQSLNNLLGKMLRINKDGTVPTDNPYYRSARVEGKNKAIWARGLRNPYSFAVQPGTGRIHINDVGAQTWEEINRGLKGANYGWPLYEGRESDPNFQGPIHAYRHGVTNTTGCAITSGAFYNPATLQFPARYVGDYFFADFCNGWIRRLDLAQGTVTLFKGMSDERPVNLQVGSNGSLYFLARSTGSVERIRYTGN
jgi:glucose/arabinose dehydrogenase